MDQTALSAYQEHGFEDRKSYLKSLAEDNGVDYRIVRELALMLGPNEDFDGLVVAIEDYSCSGW
jgi:hypothetical protein